MLPYRCIKFKISVFCFNTYIQNSIVDPDQEPDPEGSEPFLQDLDPKNLFGSRSGAERIPLQILFSKSCFFMLEKFNLISENIFIDLKVS